MVNCQDCVLEVIEGPVDCGCLELFCDIGDVQAILKADAGTLSGGACTSE